MWMAEFLELKTLTHKQLFCRGITKITSYLQGTVQSSNFCTAANLDKMLSLQNQSL